MPIRSYQGITPKIHPTAFVDEAAVVIGNVMIGEDASVWPMVAIRGDVETIRIGARSNIQDGSILHVTGDSEFYPGGFALTIGDDVTVGHAAILHACTIESLSLIGMGTTVLDGAVIESGAMVGAGSLVSPGKRISGGFLWLGSPAKKIRTLNDQEKAFLKFSAAHYVQVKNLHQ